MTTTWLLQQADERGNNGPICTHCEAKTSWRAELWHQPYIGPFIAATKWRSRKSDAARDGNLAFGKDRRWQD